MNGTAPKRRELPKRGKKPSTYRRMVTRKYKREVRRQSDERIQAYEFKTVPGYEHTLIWVNATTPDLSKEQRFDRYPDSVVPGPGGTSLHFVTFPPIRSSRIRPSMARPRKKKRWFVCED